MGRFVEKYIHLPLQEIDRSYLSLRPIQLVYDGQFLNVKIGDQSFSVSRLIPEIIEQLPEDSDSV